MSKLTDFLGRSVVSGPADSMLEPAPEKKPEINSELVDGNAFAAIGAQIGEENEALRAQLVQVGRKLDELDVLKQTVGNILDPVAKLLHDFQQEKSQNLDLRSTLAETRGAHEKLRTDFYAGERKIAALETDNEQLREDIEHAQHNVRGLETSKLDLFNELNTRQAQIADLERQLAVQTAQGHGLSDDNRELTKQGSFADKRIVALEAEVSAAQEKVVLSAEEIRSLQKSLDHTTEEASRLSRRLAETENALAIARTKLAQAEGNITQLESERDRLSSQYDEAQERHRVEANALSTRLDSLQSRSATAEKLLAEARQNLIARTEEVRGFDRKAVEATIGRNSADKKLRHLEGMNEALERQIVELTQSRASMVERSNAVTKTLKAREASLARAEERIHALGDRVAQLENDFQLKLAENDKRTEALNSELNRERMERAVAEGALEASRKDFARLQRDMMTLNTAQRRGTVTATQNAPLPSAAPILSSLPTAAEVAAAKAKAAKKPLPPIEPAGK